MISLSFRLIKRDIYGFITMLVSHRWFYYLIIAYFHSYFWNSAFSTIQFDVDDDNGMLYGSKWYQNIHMITLHSIFANHSSRIIITKVHQWWFWCDPKRRIYHFHIHIENAWICLVPLNQLKLNLIRCIVILGVFEWHQF